jgi:hypothetical protein
MVVVVFIAELATAVDRFHATRLVDLGPEGPKTAKGSKPTPPVAASL